MTRKVPTQNAFEGDTPKARHVLVSTASADTPFSVGTYPPFWTETLMLYAWEGS